MVNKESIEAMVSAEFYPGFIRPLYESFCFSRIPGSIYRILCEQESHKYPSLPLSCLPEDFSNISHIVFILIDGFGWNRILPGIEGRSEYPLLGIDLFKDHGRISVLTSQFPSTTVVHTVTTASGLMPGEAGIMEWNYYEPRLGRVITPFLMNFAGDKNYGSLLKKGYNASDIFPEGLFIKELKKNDIKSYIYSNVDFTPSDFSRRMFSEAKVIPVYSLASGFADLKEKLIKDERAYHFLYIDSYDALLHSLGNKSSGPGAEAEAVFLLLDHFIKKYKKKLPPNTMFLVSADHGQVDISPDRAVYLNVQWPEIMQYMEKGKDGRILAGAGSSGRSIMLNIVPEKRQYIKNVLKYILKGYAEVFSHDDLMKMHAYGNKSVLEDLSQRAGDIVILAHKDKTIGWFEKDRFSVSLNGQHGGMTKEEMMIPFLSLCLRDCAR